MLFFCSVMHSDFDSGNTTSDHWDKLTVRPGGGRCSTSTYMFNSSVVNLATTLISASCWLPLHCNSSGGSWVTWLEGGRLDSAKPAEQQHNMSDNQDSAAPVVFITIWHFVTKNPSLSDADGAAFFLKRGHCETKQLKGPLTGSSALSCTCQTVWTPTAECLITAGL